MVVFSYSKDSILDDGKKEFETEKRIHMVDYFDDDEDEDEEMEVVEMETDK